MKKQNNVQTVWLDFRNTCWIPIPQNKLFDTIRTIQICLGKVPTSNQQPFLGNHLSKKAKEVVISSNLFLHIFFDISLVGPPLETIWHYWVHTVAIRQYGIAAGNQHRPLFILFYFDDFPIQACKYEDFIGFPIAILATNQ